MESKNIISILLQNCNRKAVIQELVDKQVMRASRNNGQQNNYGNNVNVPNNMNGNMHMNIPPSGNPNMNYKIPMNYGYPVSGSMMVNPQPMPLTMNNIQNHQNSQNPNPSPLSPINPNITMPETPV